MYRTATRKHRHNSDYDLSADLEKIRNAFSDTALDLRGKTGEILSQSVNTVKDKTTQLQTNVADYTANNPYKSIGIALLAGVALGWFIHK